MSSPCRRRRRWGRWKPDQRDWSSGGCEGYSPLQAVLRLPERARRASLVRCFDNASDSIAVNTGRSGQALSRTANQAALRQKKPCARSGPLPALITVQEQGAAAGHLPQLLELRATSTLRMTFRDIHRARGVPPAAQAALDAASRAASWVAVGRAYRGADNAHRLRATSSEWRSYTTSCDEDGSAALPVTLDNVEAWWASRVIGQGLKSSALRSVTSRVLTHAAALGQPTDEVERKVIWGELSRFTVAFPCDVSSAAPALDNAGDNRLDTAIDFCARRAHESLILPIVQVPPHPPADSAVSVLPPYSSPRRAPTTFEHYVYSGVRGLNWRPRAATHSAKDEQGASRPPTRELPNSHGPDNASHSLVARRLGHSYSRSVTGGDRIPGH